MPARSKPAYVVVFETENIEDSSGEATEAFGTFFDRTRAVDLANRINDATKRLIPEDSDVRAFAFVRELHAAPVRTATAIVKQLLEEEEAMRA